MQNVSFGKNHQGASKKKFKLVEETIEQNEINLLPLNEITSKLGDNLEELKKHYKAKSVKELYDAIVFLERVHSIMENI
jgi:hypothetical protein